MKIGKIAMVETRTLSIDGNIVKILCIPSGNESEAFELTIDIENNIILDDIKNNQHAISSLNIRTVKYTGIMFKLLCFCEAKTLLCSI